MRGVNYSQIPFRIKHRIEHRIKRKTEHDINKMQEKQLIHFLHIGKTGGTAIKYALEHYPASGPCEIYLHGHDIRLSDIFRGESVIFFLRDPISRFISGFFSRQRQGQPRYFFPWSPDERRAFEYFHTPDHLATAISSSNIEEKDRAHGAMKSIQHLRYSYWDWFKNEEYFRSRLSDIFFIGFQEHLIEDFNILKSKLSLPENAKLPGDDILAHRNPSGLDKILTDEAIKNLKEWYKDDFNFIALCEEIIRENPTIRDSRPIRRSIG